VFFENSDEPHYEPITLAIMAKINGGFAITTTTHLQETIAEALLFLPEATRKDEIKKACQRCFQALRIEVNNEFGVVRFFFRKTTLCIGSKCESGHSFFSFGEDRRVKKSFQSLSRAGIYSEVAPDIIRASAEECYTNPRARSAKLRWAIKS
jgi:16S rRNA (cytosine1402-N4)-methyltransferase